MPPLSGAVIAEFAGAGLEGNEFGAVGLTDIEQWLPMCTEEWRFSVVRYRSIVRKTSRI